MCIEITKVNLSVFVTDCFMKTSLQSSEQILEDLTFVPMISENSSWNMKQYACKQIQIN